MSLKVFGTGLGRTGTYSLKLALELLGFGKCYHMTELFQNPEGLKHFLQAEKGEKVSWDELFHGYNSAVDYPAARYYKQIAVQYPEAKVIHTHRDPDEWYDSALKTIFLARNLTIRRLIKFGLKYPVSRVVQKRFHVFRYNRKLMTLEFGNDLFDRRKVLKAFEQHTENVVKRIPSDRLLIFKAADGWEPLCRFLNVPVPKDEFPYSNTRDEFLKRIDIIGRGDFLQDYKA